MDCIDGLESQEIMLNNYGKIYSKSDNVFGYIRWIKYGKQDIEIINKYIREHEGFVAEWVDSQIIPLPEIDMTSEYITKLVEKKIESAYEELDCTFENYLIVVKLITPYAFEMLERDDIRNGIDEYSSESYRIKHSYNCYDMSEWRRDVRYFKIKYPDRYKQLLEMQ